VARVACVRAHLQMIQVGDEPSKFYFGFLKRKNNVDRVTSLCRHDGSLGEDSSQIKNMFGLHFQNIFSLYALTDSGVETRH
jgi:hypothetical protein